MSALLTPTMKSAASDFVSESHHVSDMISMDEQDNLKEITISNKAHESLKSELKETIAKRESTAVFRLRIVVGIVLIVATVGIAVGVYHYTFNIEDDEFHERFHASADKILESVGSAFDRTLSALDSFAANSALMAQDNNQTWPFVTMPHFALRAAKVLGSLKGAWFGTYVRVQEEQRSAWEQYSLDHDSWVDECFDAQEKGLNDTFFGKVSSEWDAIGYINSAIGVPAPHRPIYFPIWQSYPVTNEVFPIYNFDVWVVPFLNVEKAYERHQASISQAYLLPDPDDPLTEEYDGYMIAWLTNFLPPERNPYEPVFDVYYVSDVELPCCSFVALYEQVEVCHSSFHQSNLCLL
jgi:hypothetical protein